MKCSSYWRLFCFLNKFSNQYNWVPDSENVIIILLLVFNSIYPERLLVRIEKNIVPQYFSWVISLAEILFFEEFMFCLSVYYINNMQSYRARFMLWGTYLRGLEPPYVVKDLHCAVKNMEMQRGTSVMLLGKCFVCTDDWGTLSPSEHNGLSSVYNCG